MLRSTVSLLLKRLRLKCQFRIKIAQKLSSYNAFQVAFGEQTTRKWQSAKAGAIEVYDPDVVTMEM